MGPRSRYSPLRREGSNALVTGRDPLSLIHIYLVGDAVSFVINRNINYTNVCTFKCRFCAFSKGPLSLNLRGDPYLLTLEEISGRVREAEERGATEVCLQGGIHPNFDGDYYIDVIAAVRAGSPLSLIHIYRRLWWHLAGDRRSRESRTRVARH